MDSFFTHKKCSKLIIIFVLFLFIIILLLLLMRSCEAAIREVGSNIQITRYRGPYDFPGSVWVSEDPVITLMVSEKQGASVLESTATMTVDGTEKDIVILLEPKNDNVYFYERISAWEYSSEIGLWGKWTTMSDTEVTFTVLEDHLLSNEYTSITLKKMK